MPKNINTINTMVKCHQQENSNTNKVGKKFQKTLLFQTKGLFRHQITGINTKLPIEVFKFTELISKIIRLQFLILCIWH